MSEKDECRDSLPWLNADQRQVVVLIDGSADLPQDRLSGQTPLQAAQMPTLDYVLQQAGAKRETWESGDSRASHQNEITSKASDSNISLHQAMSRHAYAGAFQSIPLGCYPGSEVANLTILGYSDMAKQIRGRAALEALALGIELNTGDCVFRCDWADFPEDLPPLPLDLGSLVRGLGHRHIYMPDKSWMDQVGRSGSRDASDILHRGDISIYLQERLNAWIRLQGLSGDCRLWSPSASLAAVEPFAARYDMQGVVIAAVPVIKGIGLRLGMYVPTVEGATGDVDSDLSAKCRTALESLDSSRKFIFLHIEAADECSHRLDPIAKRDILSRIDYEVFAPLYEAYHMRRDFALTILPDHYTDSSSGEHLCKAVPFVHLPNVHSISSNSDLCIHP